MDELIQFVKEKIKDIKKLNTYIDFVIETLKSGCDDIEEMNKILTVMGNINATQEKRIKQGADLTKPAEVVDLSLEVIESSSYLSLSSTIILFDLFL